MFALILLALCLLLPRPQAFAQQFVRASDVRLEVRTRDGQKTFYIGQIIPIELRFSSNTPGTYQLDMAKYDRSGRMDTQFRWAGSRRSDEEERAFAELSSFAASLGIVIERTPGR